MHHGQQFVFEGQKLVGTVEYRKLGHSRLTSLIIFYAFGSCLAVSLKVRRDKLFFFAVIPNLIAVFVV